MSRRSPRGLARLPARLSDRKWLRHMDSRIHRRRRSSALSAGSPRAPVPAAPHGAASGPVQELHRPRAPSWSAAGAASPVSKSRRKGGRTPCAHQRLGVKAQAGGAQQTGNLIEAKFAPKTPERSERALARLAGLIAHKAASAPIENERGDQRPLNTKCGPCAIVVGPSASDIPENCFIRNSCRDNLQQLLR